MSGVSIHPKKKSNFTKVDLENALLNNEFAIHYQPLIDLENSTIFGYEALVRWNSPSKGMIPPNEFIRCAEENGFIHKLGRWIFSKVCSDYSKYFNLGSKLAGRKPIVHINVSPIQLAKLSFPEFVVRNLLHFNISSTALILELTESILVSENQFIEKSIQSLNSSGISFSLDDFGTGYSALAYITRFKFESIKIDRSLLISSSTDPRSLAVMNAVVAMAKAIGAKTVAEGIETDEQSKLMKNLGVDYAQGYFYYHPFAMEVKSNSRDKIVRQCHQRNKSKA